VTAIVDLILATIDLVKAELRQSVDYVKDETRKSRETIFQLAIALSLVFAAFLLILAGLAFLLGAIYMGLAGSVSPPWAAFFTALISILFAAVLFWIAVEKKGP
jgi:hypothetical protein